MPIMEDKMLTAITGINWGDEGKGRMVDLLSKNYDVVVRYQGGNNAGHTVVNEKGKFILNLLPSGILRDDVVNVIGNGVVVDIKHLAEETKRLTDAGIKISPEHLKLSDRAVICMPYNVMQDVLEENRLAGKKFGSTRRGIAPIYGDKYMKKAIRLGELKDLKALEERLKDLIEWKNLTIVNAYNAEPVKLEDLMKHLKTYGEPLLPYICDTGLFLDNMAKKARILCLKPNLVRFVILTLVFIHIQVLQTLLQHTHLSVQVFLIENLTCLSEL